MNIKDLKAKTEQQGGTSLCDHTVMSINVANALYNRFLNTKCISDELPGLYEQSLYTTGFHDLLKVMDSLQKYYVGKAKAKDTFLSEVDGSDPILQRNKLIPHNIATWAFLRNNTSLGKTNENDCVHSGVLYHHVVNGGEDYGVPYTIMNQISDEDFNAACEMFDFVRGYVKDTFGVSSINGTEVKLMDCDDRKSTVNMDSVYPLMEYSRKRGGSYTGTCIHEELDKFSRNFIIRAITIFSDRFASSMFDHVSEITQNDANFIDEKLYSLTSISSRFNFITPDFLESVGYDRERIDKQFEYAKQLISIKNSILQANAGFGKTLVGLIYSILLGKKVIWVVPTNDPAYSTWLSINKELKKMGISDAISTALYYSGDYVEGNEDADILVTNIDTFLGYMIKNNVVSKLATLFSSTIIFDEFHELTNSNKPLFAAFIGTVYTLMKYSKANVLCMSATAHRLDEYFWNTRHEDNYIQFVKADIYGKDIPIKFVYREYNGIRTLVLPEKDSIVVTETRNDAITFGLDNENSGYYFIHAHFPDTWRASRLRHVLDTYGKGSTKQTRSWLIGTSLLGYALDITTTNMYDFTTSPDTTIQRCGRVNRFGVEGDTLAVYNLCVDTSKGRHKIIEETFDKRLWSKWCAYMKPHSGKIITRGEFYTLYENFIAENVEDYMLMFYSKFNDSAVELNKMKPYKVFKPMETDNKSLPSGKLTYRGNNSSIYVVAKANDGSYSEPIVIDRILVEKKSNEFNPVARKMQYNYFVSCIGKENLLNFYGVKDTEHRSNKSKRSFDDDKLDIARHRESPLLLVNARFSEKIGLILDNSSDDE